MVVYSFSNIFYMIVKCEMQLREYTSKLKVFNIFCGYIFVFVIFLAVVIMLLTSTRYLHACCILLSATGVLLQRLKLK